MESIISYAMLFMASTFFRKMTETRILAIMDHYEQNWIYQILVHISNNRLSQNLFFLKMKHANGQADRHNMTWLEVYCLCF
jgi:DUF1680 family protein